jgi:threonylcarbamoyladenosine tRNA methylthiotransferase MtaB
VIVGFPGETADDFSQLDSYLAVSPLTHVHVFPYSDRPGTDATALRDKVHGSIVRERATRLREISRRLTAEFHLAQAGSVRPALTIDDGAMAVTDNYLKLKIAPGRARNEQLHVRVMFACGQLTGEVVRSG